MGASRMVLFLLGFFLFSGFAKRLSIEHKRHPKKLHLSSIAKTSEKDITTPITTVPTITPATPTSSTPIINPNSDPDSPSPASMTPMITPATTTTAPVSSGASWCVASRSASPTALQLALDYACGYGGADCSSIQAGGSCFNPDSLRDHASFAFNSYYQKNPVPASCNFGGTAVISSTDPSTVTCQFPSTSTSSSILNITNSNGATVFGAVPSSPSSPSTAPNFNGSVDFTWTIACHILLLLAKYVV